jgi:hypothetical protein
MVELARSDFSVGAIKPLRGNPEDFDVDTRSVARRAVRFGARFVTQDTLG